MTALLVNASFGRWYPLPDYAQHMEAGPGVFQLKVARGLIDYPTGKSAMIYYGYGASMPAVVGAFYQAQRGTPQAATWLCRHTIESLGGHVMEAQRLYERLLAQFVGRFGSEPRLPCA